jgi:TonB family protein
MVKQGLVISGILHVIILTLPVSVRTGKILNNDREVELYIIDSTPLTEHREKISSLPSLAVKAEKIKPEQIEEYAYKPETPVSKTEKIEYKSAIMDIVVDEPAKEVKSTVVRRKTEEVAKSGRDSLSDAIDSISITPVQEAPTGETTSEPLETAFGATDGPDFIDRVMPEYPPQALRMNKEDTVILVLTIDRNGRLIDAKATKKAGYGFTEAAIRAVKSSTFRPAMKDGKAVTARAVLPIRFEIRKR